MINQTKRYVDLIEARLRQILRGDLDMAGACEARVLGLRLHELGGLGLMQEVDTRICDDDTLEIYWLGIGEAPFLLKDWVLGALNAEDDSKLRWIGEWLFVIGGWELGNLVYDSTNPDIAERVERVWAGIGDEGSANDRVR